MALTSTNTTVSGSVVRTVFGIFAAFWNGLISIAESNSKAKLISHLSTLSDEALAAKGIRREDIVHHVFGNTMYL